MDNYGLAVPAKTIREYGGICSGSNVRDRASDGL